MNSDTPSSNSRATQYCLHKIMPALIRAKGWNTSEFCRIARLPKATVHNWLTGAMPADVAQLKIAADILEVSLEYLCFGSSSSSTHSSSSLGSLPGLPGLDEEMRFEVVVRKVR